jgi:membrane protease YdiL (CAAX protease family)
VSEPPHQVESSRVDAGRLAAWLGFVALFSALAWGSRSAGGGPSRSQADFFSWTFFGDSLVNGAILLIPVLAITSGRRWLLGLRRPHAWGQAVGLAVLTYIGVSITSAILVLVNLHPGRQQGLLPAHWQHGHTAPFVANTIYVVALVPLIEETLVRGVGYGLLRPLGTGVAAIASAACWALMHGFPDGIPVFVVFGIGLALIRERTGSTIPGMILHGLFNGIAIALAVGAL